MTDKQLRQAEERLGEGEDRENELEQALNRAIIQYKKVVEQNKSLQQENKQLKAENEELKKKVSYYENDRIESHKTNIHNLVLLKRYKQALDEIEEYCNKYPINSIGFKKAILDIINKTKE